MSQEIRTLEPKALWNKFADLNAVPRPSKKEERVIEFIKNFGHNLGLEHCTNDKDCMMTSASGTVKQVDREKIWFCSKCWSLIK